MEDNDFNPFDIFATNDGEQLSHNMTEIMEMVMHAIEDHSLDPRQALELLIDMVRPGNSENSHDVRPMWTAAMYVQGFGPVADQIHAIYLNTLPWGLGFAISVEQGFMFEALAPEARLAVIRAMCATIQMGGIAAEVTDAGTIRITNGANTTEMSQEELLGKFRQEIEAELGPDATPRHTTDQMKRWMP